MKTMTINGWVINNAPEYAKDYKAIVARFIDGEYWFYGAYANRQQAEQIAYQLDDARRFIR